MTATVRLAGDEDNAWLLSEALRLAALGYELIPVRVTLDAATKAKRPHFMVDWQHSSSAADIAAWHEDHAPNVWAVHCGASGVDVVDQDVKPGVDGPANARAAGVPESVMSTSTPSGGRHDWFAPLGDGLGTHAAVLPGVDTRGAGGVVFAVGVLPDGRRWSVTGARRVSELAAYSSEVLGALRPLRAPGTSSRTAQNSNDPFAAPEQARSFTDAGAVAWFDRCLTEFREGARGRKYDATRHLAHQLSVLEGSWPGRVDACWTACREVLTELDTHPLAPDRVGNWTHAERAFRGAWDYGVQNFPQAVRELVPASSRPGSEEPEPTIDLGLVSILTDDDLDALPPVRSLIKGVVSRGSLVMLNGMNQSYKSFVALDWALSVATGQNWLGRQVKAAEPVLYVAAEGAYGIRQRRAAWKRHHGVTTLDNFHLVAQAVQFRDAARQAALLAHIERLRPAMVVIDTVHQSAAGLNENDAGEMSTVMSRARAMTTWGATVVLVHHTGHAGERARGSSSLGDDADEVWLIKRDEVETPGLDVVRTMHHWKAKDSQLSPEITLKATPLDTGLVDEDGEVVTSLVLDEDKELDGSLSVLKACALMDVASVGDDPPPSRTAARGTNKDTVKAWLRTQHPEVRFPGRATFWQQVVSHYRTCMRGHPELLETSSQDRELVTKANGFPDPGTTGNPFAPPAR